MRKIGDLAWGHAEAFGSGLIHAVPSLQGFAARNFLKLTEPNDRFLHWRVAHRRVEPNLLWARAAGPEGVSDFNPEEWENRTFGVDRGDYNFATKAAAAAGGQAAVAYRSGTIAMIGVRELEPRNEFLSPVNQSGEPDPQGNMMGVVMRAGENLEMVIGTTLDGRRLWPLPTQLLASVVAVPDGLYRV